MPVLHCGSAIAEALRKAQAYIASRPETDCGYQTLVSSDVTFASATPIETVFLTAYVLVSLKGQKCNREMQAAARRAGKWLLGERDPGGYWSFYGQRSRRLGDAMSVPPDVDDTVCVMSALEQ